MGIKAPLYEQLADSLRIKIADGKYAFGDKFPSERVMAAEYGISHLTVRKALAVLEKEGLLVRVQGKGTYVKSPRMIADMQSIGSFSSAMRSDISNLDSRALYTGSRKAKNKFSRLLHIDPDEEVFEIVKLKSNNNEPLSVEYTTVPSALFPDFNSYDFNSASLYDMYANNNISVAGEDQMLEIVKAYNPVAALLNKEEGDEVFLLTSTSYDENGTIIEYTKLYNNNERLMFLASINNSQTEVSHE